jgi:hypothetical protein
MRPISGCPSSSPATAPAAPEVPPEATIDAASVALASRYSWSALM